MQSSTGRKGNKETFMKKWVGSDLFYTIKRQKWILLFPLKGKMPIYGWFMGLGE
jgi:hypothetical protein